jgi:hypothetical protein
MRKPNKKAEAIQQKKREKRNASKKANGKIRQEKINHRVNVVEAKKVELLERWMGELVKQFESSHTK